jgi:hypothetical protein
LLEGRIAGSKFPIVIDGKFYRHKVDVKGVEPFIGMMSDIGAHKGLMITQEGYSQAAQDRAYNDPEDIELDILNFAELKHLQGFAAIPYTGKNGALLKAPFGWIIDGTQYGKPSPPAHLYQRGLTLGEATARKEFMYVRFWDRAESNTDISALLEIQANEFKEFDPGTKIEYVSTVERDDAKTKMRVAYVPRYEGVLEYTGFVEFEKFIFFAVLLTPTQLAQKNLRKLETVILSAMPMTVEDKTEAQQQIAT